MLIYATNNNVSVGSLIGLRNRRSVILATAKHCKLLIYYQNLTIAAYKFNHR